jgi:hypothetical protein
MAQELTKTEMLQNLRLLSEWLRVKYPGETFQLTVVGGAAMALHGFKDQTKDIDLLRPETLPTSLKDGIAHISKVKGLSAEWINVQAANIFRKLGQSKRLPDYFKQISRTIEVGDNLKMHLIGRQALITLKLYASTPTYTKHTIDIKSLKPVAEEISEAVKFVLSIDDTEPRRDDLKLVLSDIGFDYDEVTQKIER